MPFELNEADLAVVGKIQELKTSTPKRAREIYRKAVAKLANPDVEGRAETVWENIQRGSNGADVFEEKPVKEKKQRAPKAPKVAKAKKAKKIKAEVEERPDVPLPELEKEIEIKPVDELAGVYTATVFGKKHVVFIAERDRKMGTGNRFQNVGFSEKRLDAAKKYAKENELEVIVGAVVRVKRRLDQGYAIPLDVFNKFKGKEGSALAVNLRAEARAAYQEAGIAGVKFVEKKVA